MDHGRLSRIAALAAFCLAQAGCAAPVSQLGNVDRASVEAEQLTQQRFSIKSTIATQARLDAVAIPLLRAGVPLCRDRVTLRSGFSIATVGNFQKDWRAAAIAEGISDTATITNVVKGSAAERAGLRIGDRILALADAPVRTGPKGAEDLGRRISVHFAPTKASASRAKDALPSAPVHLEFSSTSLPLSINRAGAPLTVVVPADTVCAFPATVVKSDVVNAFADGDGVYIHSAMMRFAGDDDALAVVVAHEIAHNAMRHMDAKKRNALIGAFFGAVIDVALASQGVNSQGEYTSQMASLGAMTFSQDFEREADLAGLYILARTGRSLESAPLFWRQMAAENSSSIKFGSSHPSTAERFVRLEEWTKEIEAKKTSGQPLVPTLKPKD